MAMAGNRFFSVFFLIRVTAADLGTMVSGAASGAWATIAGAGDTGATVSV